MSISSSPGALHGIRVIDFGHYAAGPLAALLLAENGAEVIHVDRPGALTVPVEDDAFLNRSKRRITLDLKQGEDLATARALISRADVVIENFRPGVMQRLGLDLDVLCSQHPHLIACSLPGFSSSDPRAALPGWEGIVCSAAGLYNSQSPAGQLPAGSTPYNALPLASNFAALQAATAIVMALIAREKTGKGQRIEAPLFDCAMELLGPAVPDSFPNYTIIYGGGIYACAEGHVFFNANNPRFLFWLLDAAGITAELRAAGLLDTDCINGKDIARNRILRDKLSAMFATRTAQQWEDFAAEHHIPLSCMRTWSEWQQHDQARASGAVKSVQDPQLGPLTQPGLPINLSKSTEAIRHARHLPDQDRPEILSQLAADAPSPVREARDEQLRQALAGVRVIDLANILAGPSVGRWLADFGAEVIKINDPNSLSVAIHDYLNRGKKSALINANSPQGREAIFKLIEKSEVFLANFPLPTAQRYGYDEATVRACKSDIVYAQVTCYGIEGPWRTRRGYEPQAQAAAGIMYGYGDEANPVMLPYLVNDYGTGILGALAVGLALFHRLRTGEGQRACASLAQTASLHQWTRFAPRYFQNLYRTADGWLFIGQAQDDVNALHALFNVPAHLQSDADISAHIAQQVMRESNQTWQARCAASGVTAMPLHSQREAMQNTYAIQRGVTHGVRPRLSGTLEHPGITVHLASTPKIHGRIPDAVGTELDEVFALAGLSAQMPQLIDQGIIRHRLAKPAIAPPATAKPTP